MVLQQMGGLQFLLELALVALLAATLFHAMRLERALGVLKRDRASLEELVRGFNASTRQAEAGVERLRDSVDGAGRQIARQIDIAGTLKADLVFLNERGEQIAERLDLLVRGGSKRAAEAHRHVSHDPAPAPSYPTQAEYALADAGERADAGAAPRLRSQAERDLMKALRLAR